MNRRMFCVLSFQIYKKANLCQKATFAFVDYLLIFHCLPRFAIGLERPCVSRRTSRLTIGSTKIVSFQNAKPRSGFSVGATRRSPCFRAAASGNTDNPGGRHIHDPDRATRRSPLRSGKSMNPANPNSDKIVSLQSPKPTLVFTAPSGPERRSFLRHRQSPAPSRCPGMLRRGHQIHASRFCALFQSAPPRPPSG